MSDKKKHCSGCRNDFYNSGNNDIGVKECWSLKDAKVVTRYTQKLQCLKTKNS